ncbi:MAG TPA: biotin-dependent carboxyltransferase family protein [Motilibacteraceae bacterium]|nr:biotin-dependent carboxyltransferase family protein [Motilibacteraceae bacterium]
MVGAQRGLEVLAPGPLTTVQDLGRPGHAAVGVGRGGAADRAALRLANRLVGNEEGTAALEILLGGLALRAHGTLVVAVAGAPCPLTVRHGGRVRTFAAYGPVHVRAGAELRLGRAPTGLRAYLAVRGGLDLEPTLGSRSTDLLAGLGPPPLRPGDLLPVGSSTSGAPLVDHAPVPPPSGGTVSLRVLPGPREDWFVSSALDDLCAAPYDVLSESDRVGIRLSGTPLVRVREEELPSEGTVRGALQVPPSGHPTLFLADHPVTGGYPVLAVVASADVDRAAQVRPGQRIRFVRQGRPAGAQAAEVPDAAPGEKDSVPGRP